MRNEKIDAIVINFTEQCRLYRQMAIHADKQLASLTNLGRDRNASQVMDIINERQRLLEDLQRLDQENKSLQQEIMMELGLAEFTLGQLQDRIATEQHGEIKHIVFELGTVLKAISTTDQQNQDLMRVKHTRADVVEARLNNKEAADIYKQVMDLNKEGPKQQ